MASELIFIAGTHLITLSGALLRAAADLTVAESLERLHRGTAGRARPRTYRAPAGGRPRAGRGAVLNTPVFTASPRCWAASSRLDGLLHDPGSSGWRCATGVTASAAEDPGAARGASRHARQCPTLLAHLVDHARRRSGAGGDQGRLTGLGVFFTAHISTDLAWYALVAFAVRAASRAPAGVYRWVFVVCGAALLYFAIFSCAPASRPSGVGRWRLTRNLRRRVNAVEFRVSPLEPLLGAST